VSFAGLLAFERAPAESGRAVVRARVTAEHLNMHGSAHGGFLYSLADEAFAIASNSREADAVALSVHIDYFRPAFPGDLLVATAAEEHLGRSVATYRVEVRRHGALDAENATGQRGSGTAGNADGAPAPAEDGPEDDGPEDDGPGDDGPGETVALFTGTVYRRPRRGAAG